MILIGSNNLTLAARWNRALRERYASCVVSQKSALEKSLSGLKPSVLLLHIGYRADGSARNGASGWEGKGAGEKVEPLGHLGAEKIRHQTKSSADYEAKENLSRSIDREIHSSNVGDVPVGIVSDAG